MTQVHEGDSPPAVTRPITNSPIVVTQDLLKQFGRFTALRGISAEFFPGKLHVIIGDNGAGKSTLLRIFAGLTRPTRGMVSILGTQDLRQVCAQIGYMAHSSMLYDELSGMENLCYFAQLYGTHVDRCSKVIREVQLDPSIKRPVAQYSQGMRQRLSLARALLNDPKILLLDEPFSNVDARATQRMLELIKTMKAEGKTLFLVTHQASLLDGIADEFIFMDSGRITARNSRLGGVSR